MDHRKLTRAERHQLAFITKNEKIDRWLLMSPQFKYGQTDILFIHLVGIGFTPVEACNSLMQIKYSKIEYYENEFKEFLFYGGFETTDEFIEYYKINLLPFIITGTKEFEESINARI